MNPGNDLDGAERLPAAPILRGGHLVQEARLRAGLSQKALAQRMGTSQLLIARWEQG